MSCDKNVPPENLKDKIFMTEMPPLITPRPKTPWAKIFQITLFATLGVVFVFYFLGLSLTIKSDKEKNVVLHSTVEFHVYDDIKNDKKVENTPQTGFFDFFFPQDLKGPNVEIEILDILDGDDEIPVEVNDLVSLEDKLKDWEEILVNGSSKMENSTGKETLDKLSASVDESSTSSSKGESSSSSSKGDSSSSSSNGDSSSSSSNGDSSSSSSKRNPSESSSKSHSSSSLESSSSSSSILSSPQKKQQNRRPFSRILNFPDINRQFQLLDQQFDDLERKINDSPFNFPFDDQKLDEVFQIDPFLKNKL